MTKKSITAPVQPWQWNTLEAVGYKERIMGHKKQMWEKVFCANKHHKTWGPYSQPLCQAWHLETPFSTCGRNLTSHPTLHCVLIVNQFAKDPVLRMTKQKRNWHGHVTLSSTSFLTDVWTRPAKHPLSMATKKNKHGKSAQDSLF